MLSEVHPDVVHITTPPPSHVALAKDAADAGAHVLVEKPIAPDYEQFRQLRSHCEQKRVWLLEDHNFQFNRPVKEICDRIASGEFGEVVHVEVMYCLDLYAGINPFTDTNAPHPCLSMPGGAIADFLTHLCYLAYLFVGPHRSLSTIWQKRSASSPLPSDEFRALISAERGTALIGFSTHSQPDGVWLRVFGTKMRAMANLYEDRLTLDYVGDGPKPLAQVRCARQEARDIRTAAYRGLWRKISGAPVIYEGLWELLGRLYRAVSEKSAPPIGIEQVDAVMRLVSDVTNPRYRQ